MIKISEKAKGYIHDMILDASAPNLFLRVGVEDGGCSGLSYNIKLDDQLSDEDEVLTSEPFRVVQDKRSEEYLDGIVIDYLEQGMTGGFTIDNPNAKVSCGCGASFRTATYRGNRNKCS